MSIKKNITIYTDGACSGNPGKGGWAFLLIWKNNQKDHIKEGSGNHPDTTNNQMEIMAAICALEHLKEPCNVSLYTDSKYLIEGMKKWVLNWEKNNWKTSNKQPVKNKELWQKCWLLNKKHNVEWKWVKGHSGNTNNERVDQMAKDALKKI